MLREYLLYDLIPDDHGWMQDYDKERLIDDFVCLMILLGDDFLPELPSLDINEGSVQFIIGVYKSASQRSLTRRDVISSMHAFLIEDAKPVLPVLKALFTQIGSTEREVFEKRKEDAETEAAKAKSSKSGFARRESSPPVVLLAATHTIGPQPRASRARRPAADQDGRVHGERARQRLLRHPQELLLQQAQPAPSPYARLLRFILGDQSILDDVCKRYYEGVQWILFYYYRGVCSWSWFYPYHYSPLASDLANYDMYASPPTLTRRKYEPFTLDAPFSPFLQQLGCLPPQSAAILPPSYRPLVLDPSSPIVDFYPDHFSIDMNNKKNPWEGVNLIPFTDESRMRKAIAQYGCDRKLSNEERRRNAFRPSRLYCYSEKAKGTVYFPFKTTLFDKIEPNHCISYEFKIPPPRAAQETILQLSPLRGNMLIHLKGKKVRHEEVGIVSTGRVSKQPTLVIAIPSRIQSKQCSPRVLQQLAKNCSNRLVNYPYGMTRYAVIKGLWTRSYHVCTVPNASGVFTVSPLAGDEARFILAAFDRIVNDALRGHPNVIGLGGIDIHDCCIMAEIIPILGVERRRSSHSMVYKYAQDSLLYPLQLITPVDSIYFESMPLLDLSLSQRLPVGASCVFLGSNKSGKDSYQGALGVCEKVSDTSVTLRLTKRVAGIPLGRAILKSTKPERWYSISDLRRLLQLPPQGILYITGTYYVTKRGSRVGDIGLGFHTRDQVNPGSCARWC